MADDTEEKQVPIVNTICPNGHRPPMSFTRTQLKQDLDAGTLEFYCVYCDQHWRPTPEETEGLRKLLQRP